MTKKINYVSLSISELEREYINQALFEGDLAGNGYFNKRCQDWLEKQLNTPCARLVTSCTSALEMCAILANIEPGDEIILPSFTFVSTANAFVLFGAIPVFIDIRPDTLNIDECLIKAAVTKKTKAIIPVHYAGVGCKMSMIKKIAKDYGLLVIEDAAQCIGSTYQGQALGTIGDLGALSFHQTKNITSGGEGGAILVNDQTLIERADIILEKGTNRKQFFQGLIDKYTWVDKGSSFVLSDLNAAFLFAQLKRVGNINTERIRLWNMYHEAFLNLEEEGKVRRPIVPQHCEHNAHIYYLILETMEKRNSLLAHLNANQIGAVFHYIPLHSSEGGLKYGRACGSMQVTDRVSSCMLRLPLWAGIPEEDLCRIIDAVNSFFEK
jgi:dTDP-4-amino-4,6-dideoxygalactose transaminase